MPTHTFPAGAASRVVLAECEGTLTIEAWDERNIAIESEQATSAPAQSDEGLVLRGTTGSLRLRVPGDTMVVVERQRGDIAARDIDGLTIDRADGNLRIERVATVRLHDIYGHMLIDGAESLAIQASEEFRRRYAGRESHDVEARNVGVANIEYVSGRLTLDSVRDADVRAVGGRARARAIAGDLRIKAVGGGCTVHGVGGSLELSAIGGACEVKGIGGELSIDKIGGSAEIEDVGTVRRLGAIGGSLTLRSAPLSDRFAAEHPAHVTVGGSARVELPDQPNLTIHAITGGKISGAGVGPHAGHMATLVYGEGTARLSLTVGGSLELRGPSVAR